MTRGSFFRRRLRPFGRGLGLELAGLGVCLAGLLAGCAPPPYNTIEGVNGPIRLEAVTRILDDTDLNEDQKRQALRDLGIADENLIDVLIRGV